MTFILGTAGVLLLPALLLLVLFALSDNASDEAVRVPAPVKASSATRRS